MNEEKIDIENRLLEEFRSIQAKLHHPEVEIQNLHKEISSVMRDIRLNGSAKEYNNLISSLNKMIYILTRRYQKLKQLWSTRHKKLYQDFRDDMSEDSDDERHIMRALNNGDGERYGLG